MIVGKSSITLGILQILLVSSLLTGCHVSRTIPPDKKLLVKNKIIVKGDNINESEVKEVIKQQPNMKFLGVRWRLAFYKMIRAEKAEKSRLRKLNRIKRKNIRKQQKEYRINMKRREKAIEKGDSTYIYKRMKLKDTLDPNLTFRQLIKYKLGEAPVLADTFLLNRSVDQVTAYMHSKGYFNPVVSAKHDTLHRFLRPKKFKKKVKAYYYIETNERFYIDTVKYLVSNPSIENDFKKYLSKVADRSGFNEGFRKSIVENKSVKIGFDSEKLDAYRSELARYLRDQTYYGFISSNITYKADTSNADHRLTLTLVFGDRVIQDPDMGDTILKVKHRTTVVNQVYFHICDTNEYRGDNFRNEVEQFKKSGVNIQFLENDFIVTLDTLKYEELISKVENKDAPGRGKRRVFYKSQVYTNLFGKPKDSLDINKLRIATFTYNGKMFVNPELIESQNYLEHTNYYKEYYLERSFSRMVQLGLFSVVKPEVIETYPGSGVVDVHYYLVPAVRQNFSFEPRAKNSNGFLGLSASANYGSKNIFRTGVAFTTSISGGFESTPTVFGKDENGNKIVTQSRSFNTFELGPSIKFDIPGLFPVGITKLGKRQRPRTEISVAYNYQKRTDFSRGVLQFNYLYKFFVGDGRTQVVSFGLPFMSVVKFVSLKKEPEFEAKIKSLNDLFLKSAYSDQVIWEDFKIVYEFDNLEKLERKYPKLRTVYTASLSIAGNVLNAATGPNGKADSLGRKTFLGIPFSQFTLFDNKFIANYKLGGNKSIAFRTMAGVGFPGKNSSTALPYDYSFFAGGSNENRGYLARLLGPGSYNPYLDSLSIATQIGDLRFSMSMEFRFGNGFFKHAFFADASNIWTMKYDVNRPGSQISKNFIREMGITVGYGLRLDFTYFLFRVDLGWGIHQPYLPNGERWVFQPKTQFRQQALAYYGTNYEKFIPLILYPVRLNFGIGLPF
jgi:hypothetical protein